jgi:hypothetical protein
MTKELVTCYVDVLGDLVTLQTGEYLRRATTTERRDSRDQMKDYPGTPTGAIEVAVPIRTLKRRAPQTWHAICQQR